MGAASGLLREGRNGTFRAPLGMAQGRRFHQPVEFLAGFETWRCEGAREKD